MISRRENLSVRCPISSTSESRMIPDSHPVRVVPFFSRSCVKWREYGEGVRLSGCWAFARGVAHNHKLSMRRVRYVIPIPLEKATAMRRARFSGGVRQTGQWLATPFAKQMKETDRLLSHCHISAAPFARGWCDCMAAGLADIVTEGERQWLSRSGDTRVLDENIATQKMRSSINDNCV